MLVFYALLVFCVVALYAYVYVYMCAHKKSGCKGTKKIPHMQIYMGNFFKNIDFASEMRGFESKEVVDWENYRDDKSIILIINFQT